MVGKKRGQLIFVGLCPACNQKHPAGRGQAHQGHVGEFWSVFAGQPLRCTCKLCQAADSIAQRR